MTINFKAPEIKELKPRILVLGVGGAGGNAINEMIDSGVEGVATAELDVGWVGVLANPAGVMTHHRATFVHLLGEHAIFWMQEFSIATGKDAVDLEIFHAGLELGPELGAKSQALLFPCEIHDVFAGIHHRGTACGQLKGLFAFAGPGDRVFLFSFGGVEKPPRARNELRKLTVQSRSCHGAERKTYGYDWKVAPCMCTNAICESILHTLE